jgi:hypothetical protein
MLVRALKVLDYFLNETASTGIDTAALDQPGDEVALMAEPSRIGNDEPRKPILRPIKLKPLAAPPNGEKIMISPQPIAVFTASRILRSILAMVLFAVVAAPDIAGAASARRATAVGGGYDGYWNVLIITQAGPCDQAYNFPFQISGGRISSSGFADVTGRVSGGGGVAVRVSAGGSVATGSGRLSIGSGAGRWMGKGSAGMCSGRWQARRG